MARYSSLERLQMGAYRKLAAATQALPKNRLTYDQWVVQVRSVTNVAAFVKRVTLAAEEFRTFAPAGADEYFGLIMPPVDMPLVMPDVNTMNVRAAVNRIPAHQRPDLRWYTIRSHRPGVGEVDVDIVTHGTSGPGSRWALSVSVGDEAGFRCGSAAYDAPESGAHQLIIGDETSLPAIAAIADAVRDNPSTHDRILAAIEVPDDDHATPLASPFSVVRLQRGDAAPGSLLLPALAEMSLPPLDYAWACGESALATGARRFLVKTHGMHRRSVMFSGYWKVGAARC